MSIKWWAAAAAAVMTMAAAFGAFYETDMQLSDQWYQHTQASYGDVVLVEINEKALEAYGPFSDWGRGVIAKAIEALNESEECHPAVIGVDVLYSGTTDPEADRRLAEAAGKYGNVVTACAATFSSGIREAEDGSFYRDGMYITHFDEPYKELKECTEQGHINAMYDNDGILRHCLWKIDVGENREIFSFGAVVAEKFREYMGEDKLVTPPLGKRGFWYLPYTGGPGYYSESISVEDVIEGNVPADYFADRIVLIGPYAPGLQDRYLTSNSHAEYMYGMEYQANMIEALLREDYKKEAGEEIQLAILFLVLYYAALFFWKRNIRISTAAWIVTAVGWLFFARWMYGRGTILHLLWIPLGVTVFYIVSIGSNYAQAALEKHRITNTFKKYVAPEVVNEILNDDARNCLAPGGRVVDIAVLFVDVRGFTTMSEALSPDQVVEILNRYLTLTAKCIMDHRGTLDKFIGDATMAFWGAPIPQEDYVMNAAKAAIAMRDGSEELSKELMERFARTVAFGIGIHVGKAVVGNIGSPKRMDYTAIGDTVNTASRIESIAPGGTIYISPEVAERLRGRIRTTPLDHKIHLKGKAEDQEILILEEILE